MQAPPKASPRDVAAAAADLLDQGAIVDRLSRPLTIAALIGLIVGLGVELGALLIAGLLLVTLAGLAETYLALRTGFDAALFRRLATGDEGATPDLGKLDAALIELGLIAESKTERAIEQRALARAGSWYCRDRRSCFRSRSCCSRPLSPRRM